MHSPLVVWSAPETETLTKPYVKIFAVLAFQLKADWLRIKDKQSLSAHAKKHRPGQSPRAQYCHRYGRICD